MLHWHILNTGTYPVFFTYKIDLFIYLSAAPQNCAALGRECVSHTDLLVPRRHDVLHVDVAGEKGHDAVGDDGRHLKEQVAVVTDHGWGHKKENINTDVYTEKYWACMHTRINMYMKQKY